MRLWVLSIALVVETVLLFVLLLLASPILAVLILVAVLARVTRAAALRTIGESV